jgi:hypothetical protein
MAKRLEILTVDLRMQALQHDRQAKKSTTSVRNYAREAKKAESASSILSAGFSRAANQAGVMYGPLNGLSGRLSAVSSGLGPMGIAGFSTAAALGGLTVAAVQALGVFGKWESQQLKTEALIKSTGSAAGFTAGQLEDLARSNALNTLGSVEGARTAINILQTFKTVQGDAFTGAIALSHDLAAVMEGDVKSAALQLGKALEDPTTGLTALKRSGVSFSETEKEMIKDLQEHNKLSEAQAIILEKVHSQVGGAGVAAAQGLEGAMDTLGQRYDEFLFDLAETSTLGAFATSAINDVARSIDNWNKVLFPDDRSRLNDYVREREEKLKVLSELGPKKDQNFLQSYRTEGLEKDISGLNKEIQKIQDKEVTRQKGISAAKNAAQESELIRKKEFEAAKQKAEQETLDKAKEKEDTRLKKQKEIEAKSAASRYQSQIQSGAQYLSQLDLQYANEETKRAIQSQSRIDKINTAVISETEALARGYQSVADLRENYAQKEREFHLQKQQEDELKKLDKVTAFLEEELSAEAREFEAAERRQQMIADALGGREATEEAFRNASIKNWARYQKNIDKLERDKQSEQFKNSSELFGNLAGLAKGFAGEQSGIYKAMFIASKAFAVADSIVQIQAAYAKAANTPFPANIGAIGTVASLTGGIISTINSTKYHTGGIIGQRPDLKANEVPMIGLRGEEVITEEDPRHRNNLSFSSNISTAPRAPNVIIHNNIAPGIATAEQDEAGQLHIFLEKADEYIGEAINGGWSKTGLAIENSLGASRVGYR